MLLFTSSAFAEEVDVFILSGQSNMEGLGIFSQLKNKDIPKNVFFYDIKSSDFKVLNPSKMKCGYKPGKFGPEWGFAQKYSKLNPGRKVYLIKWARSGQPLHHGWNSNKKWMGPKPGPKRTNFYPGEKAGDKNTGILYKGLKAHCLKALKKLQTQKIDYKIKGILWMQGEADAKHKTSATEYAASLKRLKNRLQGGGGERERHSPRPQRAGRRRRTLP